MESSRSLIRLVIVLTCLCGMVAPTFAQEPADPSASPNSVVESAREPRGFIAEPSTITRVAIGAERQFANAELRPGFGLKVRDLIPGSGWISAGPGYRNWFADDRLMLDAWAALSWRGYKAAETKLELAKLARSRLALGGQVTWQDSTQVDFFGEGPASSASNRSQYGIRSGDVVGYATIRPKRWLSVSGEIGRLKLTIDRPGGFFKSNSPDAQDLFARDIVFAREAQPSFIHSELSVTTDTRDFPLHPTRGGLFRVSAGRYEDQDAGTFSFRRYEGEAARFVPLAESRVVIALHAWVVDDETDAGQIVPFYLEPSLGGNTSLRGFANYRFHDRDLLQVSAEARVAMLTHVDAAFFMDAGNVASRFSDLDISKRDYGFGLRLHSRRQTFARVDLARSSEGWRVMVSMAEPLSLSRLARRNAEAPFVP